MSGFPAWTAWAQDGSEHEFKLRVGRGATTLHVDDQHAVNVLGVRWGGGTLDVTSYGELGRSFVAAPPDTVDLDLSGGSVRLAVVGQATTSRPGTVTSQSRFTARVERVTLTSARQSDGAARSMRDTPASGDAVIPCESCSEEFPAAEMRYCADPYNAEIYGDEAEAWYCDSCLEDSRLSV